MMVTFYIAKCNSVFPPYSIQVDNNRLLDLDLTPEHLISHHEQTPLTMKPLLYSLVSPRYGVTDIRKLKQYLNRLTCSIIYC